MRKPLTQLFAGLALIAASLSATAQQASLPPVVKIVVPFAPGASTDVIARAIASQLGPRLGNNVIVENRPGASGFIGSAAVAKGPRDGSTLLFTSVSMLSAAAAMKSVPLDVLNDLTPISIMGEGPMVIVVNANSPIKTPADLVATAKARPDTITHGTGGTGTIAHMTAELLNDAAKIQLKHIPYKGASPAVIDLVSGNIDAMIAVNTTFATQVKAGRVRQVAITSLQPNPAFPGLPTMASVVPGFEVNLWTAVFAPAGTPAPLVQKLNQEINEIAKSKELKDLMIADGAAPLALSPDEARTRVNNSYNTWKKLAVSKNLLID